MVCSGVIFKEKYNKNRKDWNVEIRNSIYKEMGNKLNRTKVQEVRQHPLLITEIISKQEIEAEINKRAKVNRKYHVSELIPNYINREVGVTEILDNRSRCTLERSQE